MAYIPNSIERLTPIVGYDPYAFVMGQPSNLTVNKMRSPYDCDYFTKDVQERPTDKQKGHKFSNLKGVLKGALGLATIGLAAYGGVKLIKGHCPSISLKSIGTGICTAGGWMKGKIAQFGGFLQRTFGSGTP